VQEVPALIIIETAIRRLFTDTVGTTANGTIQAVLPAVWTCTGARKNGWDGAT
jgi:hypothetical protein